MTSHLQTDYLDATPARISSAPDACIMYWTIFIFLYLFCYLVCRLFIVALKYMEIEITLQTICLSITHNFLNSYGCNIPNFVCLARRDSVTM